jgi:hypothetical protein
MVDACAIPCHTGRARICWERAFVGKQMITLTDETTKRSRPEKGKRTSKSGRDRAFAIQELLRELLVNLPLHSDGRVFHCPLSGRIKADTVRRILIRDVLTPLA